MAGRKIAVQILGDSRSLERAFARSSKAGKSFGVSMTGLGRTALGVTGIFAGTVGLTAALRATADEMIAANKASAQTDAVLKSTGGVAGVTAEHVDTLAKSLLKLTGVDDEAVKGAENMLLTFTNVRNVAGEGNDIFDQGTLAILNMSTAMGTDLPSAAIRVGKALQDPIKGMTALRRVGVLFTDAQEDQIKSMVRSGHTMDAQKLIIRELNREFGGSAKAAGDVQPWNRLRETLLNVSGSMLRSLLPAITRITDRIQKWVDNTRNVTALQSGFNRLVRTFSGLASKAAGAASSFADAVGGWGQALTVLVGAWAGFKVAGIVSAAAVQAANLVAAGVAAAEVITHWEEVKGWFANFWVWLQESADKTLRKIVEPFSHLPFGLGSWAQDLKDSLNADLGYLEEEAGANAQKAGRAITSKVQDGLTEETPTFAQPPGAGGMGAKGKTAAEKAGQRNQWWDAMIGRQLDRVQDVKSLQGQLSSLSRIAGLVKARLAITKDITRRLTLEDKLLEISRQQQELRATLVENAQFGALGLGPGGDAKTPGVTALEKRITRMLEMPGLPAKARKLMKTMQRILAGGMGAVTEEVRQKIEEMLADIDAKLAEHQRRPRTKLVDADKVLSGLGLSRDQIRALRGRIGSIGKGGTVPLGGAAAFGVRLGGAGGLAVYGPVTVRTDNPDKLASELQKRARRQAVQTRGQRPGSKQSVDN